MKNRFFFISVLLLLYCFTSGNIVLAQGSGKTLNFDGQNDYVDLDTNVFSASDSLQAYTISAWIKTSGNSGVIVSQYAYTVSSPPDRFLFMMRNSKLEYFKGGTSILGTRVINDNRWHHVAATKDSLGNITLYVDGMSDGNGSDYKTFWRTNTLIGSGLNSGDPYLGQIDELRIWDKALTQDEIRNFMCQKLKGTENGLFGYWQFDDGSNSILTDKTSNYPGTLTNMNLDTIWTTSSVPIGDTSVYIYETTDWASKTVSLNSSEGDVFTVQNIENVVLGDGVHIYIVDTIPNSTSGITGLGNNKKYFGVFCTDSSGTKYDIIYDFKNYSGVCDKCIEPVKLYSRNDNSVMVWSAISAIVDTSLRTVSKVNESSLKEIYRAEYVLGNITDTTTTFVKTIHPENRDLISVFPNPTDGPISISSNIQGPFFADIKLYNYVGEMLYNESIMVGSNITELFDFSLYKKGFYLMMIGTQNKIITKKIILN